MKKILLFYSFIVLFFYCLSPISAQEATEEATPSSKEKVNQILQAVKERIQKKQSQLKGRAYVGILKSIAESTLTLKTRNGIKQANVNKKAVVLQIGRGNRKKIKFEDLAIGDFTIAMGYIEENEVLDARRIVVSRKPKQEIKREAIYGVVKEVDLKKKVIKIEKINNKETYLLKITKKTKISPATKLKKINPGRRLAAIGIFEKENTLTAHQVHLIPASASSK